MSESSAVPVPLGKRHAPGQFADGGARPGEVRCQRVIRSEQAGHVMPERHHDAAGQRREVDHRLRPTRAKVQPSASASTSRPSASVSTTSTVVPSKVRSTSDGR